MSSSDPKQLEREAVFGSQRGNRNAFRYLVEAHSGLLFRTAYLIVDEPSLAEDAVQETFLRAWRNIRSFRAGTAARAWLLRILTNYLTSEHRRKVIPTTPIDSAMFTPDHSPTPHGLAATNETNFRIWGAVMELGLEHRISIVLRYFGHLSVPEISAATGWREGTVKSRIHRALSEMRNSDLGEQLDIPVVQQRERQADA
ncbi:MAG: RNA polymerase sigma factor [Chloroflexi bacterium]|nr:RNA polymerase sigma factor [Chloroflexota bacterium]